MIAKERFRKIIPSECVFEEELNSSTSLDEIWLRTMNYHYHQLCFVNNMLDSKKDFFLEVISRRDLCFCTYGPLLFIGTEKSEINVYNTQENNQPKASLNLENGAILNLHVVSHEEMLIAMSGTNIEFFTLPKSNGKEWNYEMKWLTPFFVNHRGPLNCYKNISVGGTLLGIVNDPCRASIFRMKKIGTEMVEISFVAEYNTENSISQISIWSDEVTILLTSGEVIQWFLSSDDSSITDIYQEIRYQNPAWLLRGRVFCSTIFSSKLLGYWHMDRGANYWLVGYPSSELIRCRDLGTMFSAETNIEDVLCVAIKQRLLACGTKEGKILIYYLSDTFFHKDENELMAMYNPNDDFKREFNRVPDLTIRTKERPIKDISIEFTENTIHIYTWPYLTNSGLGSHGHFQCVILSEGDWVTQSERDAIDL